MRRAQIEMLSKVLITLSNDSAKVKVMTMDKKEIDGLLEFSIHFDRYWKWAILWICVTDSEGHLAMDKTGPTMRLKTLKKRVQFEFLREAV
jgi:hypothetical protein